ncbi:MAG: TraR/DksA C4-type zinc finger protein [Patescibacteria group bacterium]|nr:TraR/DksA C4-type zinc finger protein [Patescibacteria group bacterium]
MEKEIKKEEIAEIKKQLLERKNQIEKDLEKISREDDHDFDDRSAKFPEYGDKADENAQEISDYSTSIVTQRVLEKSLEDVSKALMKIDDDTYGICKYCKSAISPERLKARPTASSCIVCKTELQSNE